MLPMLKIFHLTSDLVVHRECLVDEWETQVYLRGTQVYPSHAEGTQVYPRHAAGTQVYPSHAEGTQVYLRHAVGTPA